MKFTVKFNGDKHYAFRMDEKNLGIKDVDEIREHIGCRLDIKNIFGCMDEYKGDPAIELSYEEAKRCSYLQDTNSCKVEVAPKLFNCFINKTIKYNKNNDTGEFLNAWKEYHLQEELIFQAWEKAGFPLTWEEII